MTFAEKLKAKREEKGYTQSELAKMTDLSTVTICHYEQGRKFPRANNLKEIARKLNCQPEDLRADKE